MEYTVKKFARNVLLLHGLLLAIVLALVLLAARGIRENARAQAQQQAERRQRMLATQTARGIEAYYQNILSDLNFVPKPEDTQAERDRLGSFIREISRDITVPILGPLPTPASQPAGQAPSTQPFGPWRDRRFGPNGERLDRGPGGGGGGPDRPPGGPNPPPNGFAGNGPAQAGQYGPGQNPGQNQPGGGGKRLPTARSMVMGQVLGRQLEDRVTHLFLVVRQPDPIAPKPPKNSRPESATRPTTRPVLVVRDVVVKPEANTSPTPEDLVERYHDWLSSITVPPSLNHQNRGAQHQSVSRFELFGGRGYNLVVLPVNNGNAVFVAAVPVSAITEQFLSVLNEDQSTEVLMVNDALTVMAGSRPKLVGASIPSVGDRDLSNSLASAQTEGFKGSRIVNHAYRIDNESFEPALLTTEPIDIAGRKWFIVVGSPLKDVDDVVARLFGGLFIWAIVVVVVVTGILISTSLFMIRSRMRVERLRSETMRKELDRARQIQQAWLPRAAPACRTIDVAAVNFPANHISGDFYNWFELADGRVAVVIGDVTGHGMSAAFLMATTQLVVRTTMQRITDPAAALQAVNRQLCTLIFNGQFVTLQILVVDPETGMVEVSSAGHPAPLIAHTGSIESAAVESGLVLGVDEDVEYETFSIEATPGSTLLLYTDGAADVQAPGGQRLGTAGLQRICPKKQVAADKAPTAQSIIDTVVAGVNHFRGSRELGDDLTLVALRIAIPTRRPEEALMAVEV